MAGHHDPQVLYTINGITASHIQNGQTSSLTPTGPQTMSLLMVPSSSPFADLSTTRGQNEAPEEDFYLHLHLPPELDLPLPATTQIYHQPPRGYLIPRWDLGADSGAFTRIEFPEKVHQEDIDTFETILAQCTAFLERAPPPTGDAKHKPYNPAEWSAGGTRGGGKTEPGQLVLIDEENGSIVGELAEGAQIIEDPKLSHGSKTPVEIEVSADGRRVEVRPISDEYLRMAQHPAYKDSSLVKNAAAASRLIVTTSTSVSNMLATRAETFTKTATPREKPMMFSPVAHERARKLHAFASGAADISSKTIGQVTKITQNAAAHISGRGKKKERSFDADGKASDGYRPGLLNKSMIAFSTVFDGVAEGGRSLLGTGSSAASTVVGHKYGPDAERLAGNLAGSVKNVGLVYIDVTGVTRRAMLKSVAKGMIIGKVKGGGEVVVGGGDGGSIPPADLQRAAGSGGVTNDYQNKGEPHVAEFGSLAQHTAPPGYTSELGEPLGSTSEKARPPKV